MPFFPPRQDKGRSEEERKKAKDGGRAMPIVTLPLHHWPLHSGSAKGLDGGGREVLEEEREMDGFGADGRTTEQMATQAALAPPMNRVEREGQAGKLPLWGPIHQ